MERVKMSGGTPAEDAAGFSLAVRAGNTIYVAGTKATDKDWKVQHVGDVEEQTRYILRSFQSLLGEAGATLDDVVRTRVFLRNAEDAPAVAEVHREFFSQIRPASSFVRAAPVDDDMLVEIEADAVVSA